MKHILGCKNLGSPGCNSVACFDGCAGWTHYQGLVSSYRGEVYRCLLKGNRQTVAEEQRKNVESHGRKEKSWEKKSPEVKPPLTFRNALCGRVPSLEVSPSKDT